MKYLFVQMRRYQRIVIVIAVLSILLIIFRRPKNLNTEKTIANKRKTTCGGIFSYVHHNNRLGVLLELDCETDIIAQSQRFRQLANDLALHIAATASIYINIEDIPIEVVEGMSKGIREDSSMERVPLQKRDEVITNKLNKMLEEQVLMLQSWVKDESVMVADMVRKVSVEMGENIVVRRFRRYALGK